MTLRLTVLSVAEVGGSGAGRLFYGVSDGERVVLLDCGFGLGENPARLRITSSPDAAVALSPQTPCVLASSLLAGASQDGPVARAVTVYVPEGRGLEMLRVLDAALARRGGVGRPMSGLEISEYGPRSRIRVGDLQLSFAPTGHRLAPLAIRVSDGQAILALGASGASSQSVEQLAGDADLLVLEVTAARDRHGADDGVMTALQAGKIARRRSSKRLLLNPRQPGRSEEFHKLARRSFPGPIDLAYEGIVYDLA